MNAKETVLLTVLLETEALRWDVAEIDMRGTATPLFCSEPGNLAPYLDLPLDEQASFLRHRLCGVLQRGCDRLWGRDKKAAYLVFVADGPFHNAEPELMPRVAEHMAIWMTRPPVAFYVCDDGFANDGPYNLVRVAGMMESTAEDALQLGIPSLLGELHHRDHWEIVGGRGVATP